MTRPATAQDIARWRAGGSTLALVHKDCGGYFRPDTINGYEPGFECSECRAVRLSFSELDRMSILLERYVLCEELDVIKMDTGETVDLHGNQQIYTYSRPLTPEELAAYKKKNGIY